MRKRKAKEGKSSRMILNEPTRNTEDSLLADLDRLAAQPKPIMVLQSQISDSPWKKRTIKTASKALQNSESSHIQIWLRDASEDSHSLGGIKGERSPAFCPAQTTSTFELLVNQHESAFLYHRMQPWCKPRWCSSWFRGTLHVQDEAQSWG